MQTTTDQFNLHRTAKYFMDSGKAGSPEAAVGLLQTFGLTIHVGPELAHSSAHQVALLTLINCASRTFLGGIDVVGLPMAECATTLAPLHSLSDAVAALGARLVAAPRPDWPRALIGTVDNDLTGRYPVWQVTWEGWRGGVIPRRENGRLAETQAVSIAPPLAAAICAAEAFAFHAGDHPMAGRRPSGMSLWRPGADWRSADPTEAVPAFLPSRLWLIGLGNLGQAFAWLLGCLPYPEGARPQLVLQDFDSISASNESTSLLTSKHHVGKKKTRVVADWLEARGFATTLEERRFGPWTHRIPEEPGAALCGVDNALARASLEKAGFGLVIEAGLGAGPQGFRNVSLHTFPASRAAADIWSAEHVSPPDVGQMPAYETLRRSGMDDCGVARLASRTVAVPFVGLTAAALVIAELLRRLNGGEALEVASMSLLAPEDVETVATTAHTYAFGHVAAASALKPSRHVDANATCPYSGSPTDQGKHDDAFDPIHHVVQGVQRQAQAVAADSARQGP